MQTKAPAQINRFLTWNITLYNDVNFNETTPGYWDFIHCVLFTDQVYRLNPVGKAFISLFVYNCLTTMYLGNLNIVQRIQVL